MSIPNSHGSEPSLISLVEKAPSSTSGPLVVNASESVKADPSEVMVLSTPRNSVMACCA